MYFLKGFILLFLVGFVNAQNFPGAGTHKQTTSDYAIAFVTAKKIYNAESTEFLFSTTTHTFEDLIVFSYFDHSNFKLYSQFGVLLDSVSLNQDEFHIFKPGSGIYKLESNNTFTLLIGDPVTNSVMGFFAVNESGSPLSTKLNTFMPSASGGGEHFIVFAYNDATEFTIKNLTDTSNVAAGILNRGEHFTLDNQFGKFLRVEANKPVSALSYADQGYFIPADNGTFAGTQFFGFSGYVGSWTNGIIITAYANATDYLVLDSETGETIDQGQINIGDATQIHVKKDTYFEVQTSAKVTVNNSPFAAWGGNYYHLTRQIDESGQGIGKHFLAPVIAGDVDLFSFANDNNITIVDKWSADTVFNSILDKGSSYHFSSVKTVYEITGTEDLSVLSSYGGLHGADFVPLTFTTGLPDLAISANDINFLPDEAMPNIGDPISINVNVHNYGFQTAYDISLQFFDGDPSGGQTIGDMMYIDSILPGQMASCDQAWEVPEFPEYHAVHVVVNADQSLIESNSSNNHAFKFIATNDDLLPPLATVVESPASVYVDGDSIEFDTFEISIDVFNTGTVVAENTSAVLHLSAGLELVSPADSIVQFGNIEKNASAKHSWNVNLSSIPSDDDFFFSIDIDADNADAKVLERMILINRPSAIEQNTFVNEIPQNSELRGNYPNPFNPQTIIIYELAKDTKVNLTVFDITGKEVETLIDNNQTAGKHNIIFNSQSLPSGVYFYTLTTSKGFSQSRKMILIK